MALMINQYSFIIIGLLLLATITFLIWKIIGIKYAVPVSGLILVSLVAFQILLSTHTHSSLEAFENALASEKPVLLVLYSDF